VVGCGFVLLAGVGATQMVPRADAGVSPHGRIGIYLTSHGVLKPDVLEPALAAVEAGRIDTFVINAKNMHGELTYTSAIPLASEINASTGRLDLRQLVAGLRRRGVYTIARQVLFYDPKLARYLGSEAAWVSPADERVVAYNLAVACEIAELGFDEIQFDYVRFADGGDLLPIYEDRYAAVNGFLQEAAKRLTGRVALSADVFGRVLWNWNVKRIDPIGQSLEDISAHLAIVSPMVYPSHYREAYYQEDPHRVVSEALTTGAGRIATPLRPFLQAFDRAIPPGMSLEAYIRAQIRAALESGADGYLFWNPTCEYEALYQALD